MGKKHKCKKCPECEAGEKWAVPTADFFSLLLALFIALFAIASVNSEKMKAVKEEFVKIYDYSPVAEQIHPVQQMQPDTDSKNPDASGHPSGKALVKDSGSTVISQEIPQDELQEAITKIQEMLAKASQGGGDGPLDQIIDGVLLKLPAFVPFDSFSTSIENRDVDLFIKRIVMIIEALPSSVNISVRGYTDNQHIPQESPYKDNLELSIKRAEVVMRELIKKGIDEKRLSIAGFGSSNPISQNATAEGRAKNNRVEFYIFMPSNDKTNKAEQKSILDVFGKFEKPKE